MEASQFTELLERLSMDQSLFKEGQLRADAITLLQKQMVVLPRSEDEVVAAITEVVNPTGVPVGASCLRQCPWSDKDVRDIRAKLDIR